MSEIRKHLKKKRLDPVQYDMMSIITPDYGIKTKTSKGFH